MDRIYLSEDKHRPLRARLINDKLIYLEMWANPHFGAYWIYDLQQKRILVRELQNDGAQASRQLCPVDMEEG